MRMSNAFRWLGLLLFVWGMGASMASCIYDDLGKCGLKVRFTYAYNMKHADAFAEEADWVKLWVFDGQRRLVKVFQQQGGFVDGGADLSLSQLPAGEYTFVAWAGGSSVKGELADFVMPDLRMGDSMESLYARLNRNDLGVNDSRLNGLLNGVMAVSLTGMKQQVVMDMRKCTNTIRVVLMPLHQEERLKVEDVECFIVGENGWLAYDASPYRKDELVYRPYYQELSEDPTGGVPGDAVVRQAVVMELNTSRIMAEGASRLVVRNRTSGREMLNLNLPWFLSLQAIGEHRVDWSNQEYLDRQDVFALTFFFDGGLWMQSQIIVNGWVLSLQDVEL